MANLVTDTNRLHAFLSGNHPAPAADRLYRDQNVFFVGGELPVYETLETMYDSFCMEATALFYLTFGSREKFHQGEEMARQIKKNFNVRLMARLELPGDATTLERIYAAGVDNVDIMLPAGDGNKGSTGGEPLLQAAKTIFSRWGAAATLPLGEESPTVTQNRIDHLLTEGIVPLVQLPTGATELSRDDTGAVLAHLVAGWERNSVPLLPYLPLISVMTPLVAAKAGLFRGLIDRLRDRHQLASSDIRRHLRVQPAENSLDSAGL